MREYELMAVYDLAVTEAGGAEASVDHLTQNVERVGGKVLKVDHWGRRRMAYRINNVLDADYVLTRIELDTQSVTTLSANLQIDEKVYRYLVVRADELPPPRPAPAPPVRPAEPVDEATAAPEAPTGAPESPDDATVPEEGTPAPADVAESAEAEALVDEPAPEADAAADAPVAAPAEAASEEPEDAPAEEVEADPAPEPSAEDSSEEDKES